MNSTVDLRLRAAVESGDPDRLQAILSQGVDATGVVNDNRASLLMQAVDVSESFHQRWSGERESDFFLEVVNPAKALMKVLIDAGCSVNHKDRQRNTALHVAAEYDLPEIASFLMESGARLTKNRDGETPLATAVISKSWFALQSMIEAGASPDQCVRFKDRDIPLLLGVILENDSDPVVVEKVVGALLNAGADPNVVVMESEAPLLCELVNRTVTIDPQILEMLADHGVDLEARQPPTRAGGDRLKAIDLAKKQGKTETFAALERIEAKQRADSLIALGPAAEESTSDPGVGASL